VGNFSPRNLIYVSYCCPTITQGDSLVNMMTTNSFGYTF